MKKESPDILCLQEIKAQPEQLEASAVNPAGYHSAWFPAQKKGYSGTAIFSRTEPISVRYGLGAPEFDCEGRTLIAEFPDFTLINAYFPNTQRDLGRLSYKLEFCRTLEAFTQSLRKKGKQVIVCGDFNVAHTEIDLKNPKSNQNNAGFLPEERAWIDQYLKSGYVDTFRHFNPDPGHYTWWSYRPGVREKNIGWRIDYFVTSEEMKDRLLEARHHTTVPGSDHCPIELRLRP